MTDEEKLTAGLPILPDGYGDYHNADLCRGCGACCMHLTVPPFGEDENDIEFEILPDDIKAELQAVYDRTFTEEGRFQPGVKNGPCCWLDLDTKRCKHYEHRPLTCRAFEPGPNNWVCVEDRASHGLETPLPTPRRGERMSNATHYRYEPLRDEQGEVVERPPRKGEWFDHGGVICECTPGFMTHIDYVIYRRVEVGAGEDRLKADYESAMKWLEGDWKADKPECADDTDLRACLMSCAKEVRAYVDSLTSMKGVPTA